MEVGLAITVGTVLVAAAVFAYQQAKDAAGDSLAKQRVGDLQAMVETYYTQNNAFPTVDALGEQWKAAREDYVKSPWGGQVTIANSARSAGIDGSDCLGNSTPANCSGTYSNVNVSNPPPPADAVKIDNNTDNLMYYRITLPAQSPPCCSTLYDIPRARRVNVYGYAVAQNKRGRSFYFVQSGRPAR